MRTHTKKMLSFLKKKYTLKNCKVIQIRTTMKNEERKTVNFVQKQGRKWLRSTLIFLFSTGPVSGKIRACAMASAADEGGD